MRCERAALLVLDGWGERAEREGNAIRLARTPNMDAFRARWPMTLIQASSLDVGLPAGIMGNSDVGHMNLGAGRVVYQDLVRISLAIEDGSFFENPALSGLVRAVKHRSGTLHLMGLVSDGAVHSLDEHLFGLIELARREGLDAVAVHAFTDGRDTPPKSALGYLKRLQVALRERGIGRIASVAGRFYAMDRDKRWDRTELAHRALALAEGRRASSAEAAIEAAYAAGETDEFIIPTVIDAPGGPPLRAMAPADGGIFFNFRADRARQLSRGLSLPGFDAYSPPVKERLELVTMTTYDSSFPFPIAFPATELKGLFADFLAARAARCLRIAETEKYAHVTYFFNGGVEEPWPGESRIMVPSPKVRTYDLKPEMSAPEVTEKLLEAIHSRSFDAIVGNYANADMVGHTGVVAATIAAVELLDGCLGRVAEACAAEGVALFITADHGNAEQMIDPHTGAPHTAHTTNPVPFIALAPGMERPLRAGGRLADVAPTIIDYLAATPPPEMTGRSLWSEG